jgi:hypothetical protein
MINNHIISFDNVDNMTGYRLIRLCYISDHPNLIKLICSKINKTNFYGNIIEEAIESTFKIGNSKTILYLLNERCTFRIKKSFPIFNSLINNIIDKFYYKSINIQSYWMYIIYTIRNGNLHLLKKLLQYKTFDINDVCSLLCNSLKYNTYNGTVEQYNKIVKYLMKHGITHCTKCKLPLTELSKLPTRLYQTMFEETSAYHQQGVYINTDTCIIEDLIEIQN